MLAGKRILVVEDEPLVAALVRRQLVSLGAAVVGPAPTVPRALAMVAAGDFDAALLDLNLRGESARPVADALRARGAPFAYATGYGETPDDEDVPTIAKPFRVAQLDAALGAALAAA